MNATTAAVRLSELTTEERRLLTTPYGFGKAFLGLPISDAPERKKVHEVRHGEQIFYEVYQNDEQKRILDSADPHGAKVAVRTCNGAGKTTILIPTLTYWFMALHPRAKVVITSGVDRQVREQIFPALHTHQRRFEGWRYNDADLEAPNGSHCVGFTTRQGGYFEGWHGNKVELYDLLQHDGPLMIIVDEAKSVAPAVFDAIDRCTYQRLLLLSSCGSAVGNFHSAFTKEAAFWKKHQLPASLCPHADHAKNLELILRRGINDPLVRSKVFAEFMGADEGALINLDWLTAAQAGSQKPQAGPPRYYCDFARGGDENVLAEAAGNTVRIVHAWREKDTMRACGEFIRLFQRLQLTKEAAEGCVTGDNCGLGAVVIDRLHELGWRIQRDDAGARADDPDRYVNRTAETWGEGAHAIERGEWILPDDDELRAQLLSRRTKPRSDGRMQLESKEELARRGIGSPDRADAILGAMRHPRQTAPIPYTSAFKASFREQLEREQQLSRLAGAACE